MTFFPFRTDILLISSIYPWLLIYRRYLPIFPSDDISYLYIVSTFSDTRYIGDISPIYPDIFILAWHYIQWNFHMFGGSSEQSWYFLWVSNSFFSIRNSGWFLQEVLYCSCFWTCCLAGGEDDLWKRELWSISTWECKINPSSKFYFILWCVAQIAYCLCHVLSVWYVVEFVFVRF